MKNNFTWEMFDLRFIKSIVYSEKTRQDLRPKREMNDVILLLPFIDRIVPYPDEKFVRHYRNELIEYFFARSTHLVNITKILEQKNYRGVKIGSMEEMLFNLRQLRLTSTVLTVIISELNKQGKSIPIDEDVSIFTYPKSIDLSKLAPKELSLYDYQMDAVDSLKDYFITKDEHAGILVMPTGSGKTRVATRFLLQEMVGRGYQVVWLTHRSMLIEQTADSIYSAAPIIKYQNPSKESFKMVCISGQHATIRALEHDDDVMIFSVQTLCQNIPYLQAILHKKVIIIVDEAHHTLAPSYQLILKTIKGLCPDWKLLGLTATPVRMADEDTKRLMKLYENMVIYNISMSTLIAKGILATPNYISVDTNIDFDTTISLDERAYIKKWGELSPRLMEYVAQTAERNELIVRTYLDRREEFGKTLIFALNSTHCISLCEALQKNGVRCDYIYCAHPGNEEKISRFKSGELDVLVNINVMTEGSDVPDIQTVFLTRPTSSDVLLMQMIGRGMRGKDCGGTETINIVDFHDIWGNFAAWLNPVFLIPEPPETDKGGGVVRKKHPKSQVPWAMVRELFESVKTSFADTLFADSVLPSGWYDIFDEDGNDTKVLVFESQLDGYKMLWKERESWKSDVRFDSLAAWNRYFGGFGWVPSLQELQFVIDYYRLSNEMPHLYPFTDRMKIDAAFVGKHLREINARLSDVDDEISRLYRANSEVISSVYGSLDKYAEKVNDFIRYPDGQRPIGMKIDELPFEYLTLDPTPVYDINELVHEVVGEMFGGVFAELPPINWTDRPYSTYFGVYSWPANKAVGQDYIRINCVLNSKDVPRETVKYVLYHELLHKENHKHDKEFRSLEHKYPDFTVHEHFLAFTFPKFDLKYAL